MEKPRIREILAYVWTRVLKKYTWDLALLTEVLEASERRFRMDLNAWDSYKEGR